MATALKNRKVIVGVTGGIACYKACELVRLLVTDGANVHVVMTKGAMEFVTPMTFQALSQNTVRTNIFSLTEESAMSHIALADAADLFVIAPATAHFIAKAAGGLADDLLTTVLLATKSPVLMAPAMNVNMFENPVTQENITRLKKRGIEMIGPAAGDLACGWQGQGRMAEAADVVTAIRRKLPSGLKILP